MCGIEHISSDKLTLAHIPEPDDDLFVILAPFTLTFDGYLGGRRSIEDCWAIARKVEEDGLSASSIDDLRTAAFICQRAIRWNDPMPPDSEWEGTIRQVVGELRRRITGQPARL